MESQRYLCCLLLLALFAGFFVSSSVAYANFYVGGKDGWVLSPSESYAHWAGRNRFQVNDTLVFKYKKGSDSVLLVNKDDYYSCNRRKALKTMTSGSSVFQFPRSGPFYFISGKEGNCEKGQKLIVVVLAVRPKPSPKIPPPVSRPPSTAPQAPPPVSLQPPSIAPLAPSPGAHRPPQTPSITPVSPSPHSPSPGWAPVPSWSPISPPESTPSPYGKTPTLSPVPAQSPMSPSPALAPMTPEISPAPSPTAKTPASSPTPTIAPSPLVKPPAPAYSPPSSSPTPTQAESPTPTPLVPNPPATTPESGSGPGTSPNSGSSSVNAPVPPPSASWAVTPSSVMVFIVSVLVSAIIGVSA